jgi:hypothetical protein
MLICRLALAAYSFIFQLLQLSQQDWIHRATSARRSTNVTARAKISKFGVLGPMNVIVRCVQSVSGRFFFKRRNTNLFLTHCDTSAFVETSSHVLEGRQFAGPEFSVLGLGEHSGGSRSIISIFQLDRTTSAETVNSPQKHFLSF